MLLQDDMNMIDRNRDITDNSVRSSAKCIIVILFLILTVMHFIITNNQLSRNPSLGSLQYTESQWDDAMCLNDSSYYYTYPQVLINEETSCSFEYPDDDGTFYDCCKPETCYEAFQYNIFESQTEHCQYDMSWIKQASCHPLNKQFVGEHFNISLSPTEKNRLNITSNYTNSVALCYIYCQQVFTDCSESVLISHPSMTVAQYYENDAVAFCQDALGVALRYEVFSNHCYSGSSCFNVQSIFIFCAVIVFIQQVFVIN